MGAGHCHFQLFNGKVLTDQTPDRIALILGVVCNNK
jgi:hypothetical protein